MANPSLVENFVTLIKKLYPTGAAWSRELSSNLNKYQRGHAPEFCRVQEEFDAFIEEVDPRTTNELLTDWERALGLPDACTGPLATVQERRNQVLQKLTTRGKVQNAAFFEEIAAQLGFTVTVTDFNGFRVGKSVVGEALTNDPWFYWFQVDGPSTIFEYFRVGQNVVGEPLRLFGNDTLECTINKLKPAHTDVLFVFS